MTQAGPRINKNKCRPNSKGTACLLEMFTLLDFHFELHHLLSYVSAWSCLQLQFLFLHVLVPPLVSFRPPNQLTKGFTPVDGNTIKWVSGSVHFLMLDLDDSCK